MKQQEILQHIKDYNRTGIIADALIPIFDQNGRWRGDQIPWQVDIARSRFTSIQNAFLPASRRTKSSRSGTVLRTSMFWRGDKTLKLCYSRVEGSIITPDNTYIHANELRSVGGNFVTNTTHRVQLPNLTVVGGYFEALHCLSLNAPQLRHVGGDVAISANVPIALESVGGSLRVYWSLSLLAPRLQYIGKYFTPHRCTGLVLPVLEVVGGALVTQTDGKIDAPKLHTVRGDFLAPTAHMIRAPRLRVVNGNMDTRSAKDYYHPAITVGGQWVTYAGAVEHWIQRTAARMAMRGSTWPMFY